MLLSFLIRSAPARPIAWLILGFCTGLYLFFRGFVLLQRRHLILNTPASKVRSAALGLVELNGLAAGPYTITAPVTTRPCYYYRTTVREWKQSGRSKQWVTIADECFHVPFFLDDNTGSVMVNPRGAELDLHRDFHQEFCDSLFTMKEDVHGNVRSFLSRHGVSTTNKIQVEEFCIKPKNALFVLGTLAENPGLELTPQPIQEFESRPLNPGKLLSCSLGGALSFISDRTALHAPPLEHSPLGEERIAGHSLRELGFDKSDLYRQGYTRSAHATAGQVIHLSSAAASAPLAEMTQQQKVAAALEKAGITNPAAWAAAGVLPSAIPLQNSNGSVPTGTAGQLQSSSNYDTFESNPPVILMKGTNNTNFFISWRSQREVARTLGWKCSLMIWGGPALALLCLYGLHILTAWF